MAQPSILTPGTKVGGKYEIVEVIGFGGMGLVYKVREQVGAVSRIRALKTVLPQYATDAGIMARFRQEAEKMCLLEHENIVPVLSYSEEGEFPFLVMPFIEGQTLRDYLATYVAEHGGRGLPLSDVMAIGLEVARGLEVAHGFVNQETGRPAPMVHRDIKPGNIMVRVENPAGGDRRLKVLIMDFGIAKVISGEDSGHTLTEVIGTVKYASPEQIRRGRDIDPRADIYSLGMVLYELYSGRHMFAGLPEHSVLMRMMQRDVQDHAIPFPEDAPERFRELIQRCVAVDREHRFASVSEMRTVMRRILEEDSERISTDADEALTFAHAERSRAIDAGAEQFAPEPLSQAEALLAQGQSAISERSFKDGAVALRSAAEAFTRAASSAAEGRERARMDRGRATLSERREAARAADASRLAAREWAAAEKAEAAFEEALAAGDLGNGSRLLSDADRAWQEAEAHARHEALRSEASAACARLDEGLARQREQRSALSERLRELTGGDGDLASIEAAAESARAAATKGDLSKCREIAAEAGALLSALQNRSDAALSGAANELSAGISARVGAMESSPNADLAQAGLAEVKGRVDSAARLAAERRFAEAATGLEECAALLDRIEAETATRGEERRHRAEAAERNRRAEQPARRAFDALVRARGSLAECGPARGPETSELDIVSKLAADAEEKFEAGEFGDAVAPLQEASERFARLAETIRAREERERLTTIHADLRSRAMIASQDLVSLGPEARGSPDGRRLLADFAEAEEQAGRGDLAGAIRILESSLPELERHIVEARAALEKARAQAEANTRREAAEHSRESVRRLGERATASDLFAQLEARMDAGDVALASGDFAVASEAFEAAHQFGERLREEIENADRAARLSALGERREALASRLAALPTSRRLRRRRRSIDHSMVTARAALERGAEDEATRLIDEIEIASAKLEREAAELAAVPPREIPWRAIAAAGGGAAALATAVVLYRSLPTETRVAKVVPTTVPIVPKAAETPQIALAPTAAPTVAVPTPAATAAAKPTEPAPEPTAAPRPEPTAVPRAPLALASAQPTAQTLKILAGSEARFSASLKKAEGASLEWRLAGEPVGHGRTLVLDRRQTASPRKTKVEVIASRDSERVPLRTWTLEIEPPPLGFAKLDPPGRSVERPSGALVSFRAPIKSSDENKLSFLWEVNGKVAAGVEGPRYDFRPDSPGEYVVQVRATAPWGASVANTWRLSITPPPTPKAIEELKKPMPSDPREEARAWIQAYCNAFQRKDTDALLALGHLTSRSEASRLREALDTMQDLKVSCSNPSIRVNGDQAVVSFDRTDRWTDPRGAEVKRALPRITKTLRWNDGHWVAVP